MNVPTQNAAKAWMAAFIAAVSEAIEVAPNRTMIVAVKLLHVILVGLIMWQAVYWTPNKEP